MSILEDQNSLFKLIYFKKKLAIYIIMQFCSIKLFGTLAYSNYIQWPFQIIFIFILDIKTFRIFLFEPCHYLLLYIYVKRYLLFSVYIKHAMIKITIWLIYSQSHIFFDILIVELFFTMEMNTYIKKEIKMWTWEISFLIFHKELGLKPDQTITNI